MKRVLITGAGSYLGESIAAELTIPNSELRTPNSEAELSTPSSEFRIPNFEVETLDMQNENWEQTSFTGFDAILHVAGIAHQQEGSQHAEIYYRVNRDLAVRVAEKAKAEGVKQFVFFSSMSVYGISTGHITAETPEQPNTHYGRSKLMAEQMITPLGDEQFQVAVLRPPMIYGKSCRGNYPRLSRMVQKLPMLPKVRNERSMLYIGHLCAFIRRLVESGQGGCYFPQNREYVSTDELVRQIALAHGKDLWQPIGFGWLINLLAKHINALSKVFGSLTYDRGMSRAFSQEDELSFAQTIRLTEDGS